MDFVFTINESQHKDEIKYTMSSLPPPPKKKENAVSFIIVKLKPNI